jgi:gliding motility-associated-like protein
MMINKITLVLLSVFFAFASKAQVEMLPANQPPYNPTSLIENVFLGEGVIVQGIQFQGNFAQVGYFNGLEQDIGIGRGIVMTTGNVALLKGDGCADDASVPDVSMCGNTNAGMGIEYQEAALPDPDLSLAINKPDLVAIFDQAIYEITFVPLADTLRFQYVFASEEYNDFVCSEFNDVFGFFISGPGINGPYTNNAKNIALVPGTDLPVSINSVNNGTPGASGASDYCISLSNSQFFNENAFAPNSNARIEFNGFTNVFTAEAVVVPCQTYTIRLAIGDVSDGLYDSGVFLAAKSFGTGSLDVVAASQSIDGSLAEGCGTGEITFSLPAPATRNMPLNYTIFGSAENGIDYQAVPLSLSIPIGQQSATLSVRPLEDNIAEATDTFFLAIQKNICEWDTLHFFIKDNFLEKPQLPDTVALCSGNSAALDASIGTALPPVPIFSNTDDFSIPSPTTTTSPLQPIYSPIQVNGVAPDFVKDGLIDSVCLTIQHTRPYELSIYLIAPSGEIMLLSSGNGNIGTCPAQTNIDGYYKTCFVPNYETGLIRVDSLPTCDMPLTCFTTPYCPNFAPFTGHWLPEGLWSDLNGATANGTWQLMVVDDRQFTHGTLMEWSIAFKPKYEIGYQWLPQSGLDCTACSSPNAAPTSSTQYIVEVSDSYGCSTRDTTYLMVTDSLGAPLNLLCGTVTASSITVSWDAVDGATSYEASLDGATWENIGNLLSHTFTGLPANQDIAFFLRAMGGCGGRTASGSCRTNRADCPTDLAVTASYAAPICENDTLFLQTNIVNGNFTGFAWEGQNGFSAQAQNPMLLAVSLANAGTYSVTATDINGCTATASATVSVNALPVVSIMGDTSLCAGDTLRLEGSGGNSYTWSGPNGFAASTQNIATDNLTTGGNFSVTATDGNGCTATASTTVSVNALPVVSIMGDTSLCAGDTLRLSASGGNAYTWSGPNGFAASTQNIAIDNLTTGGNFSVTATDGNGCMATASTTVSVNALPVVSITGDTSLCAGDTLRLSASGGNSYTWSGPNGFAANTQDITIENIATGGDFSVTATGGNGCTATASTTVSVNALPVVSIMGDTSLCAGDTLRLSASGGNSYTWSGPNGFAANSQSIEIPNVGPANAGNYTLVVSDGVCRTTTSALVSVSSLEIEGNVVGAGCTNNEGSIELRVSGGLPPYEYLWSNGSTSNPLTALQAGTYAVTATDAIGCTVIDSFEVEAVGNTIIQLFGNDPSCYGEDNGSVRISAIGDAGPYMFSSDGQSFSTDSLFTGLAAGFHDFWVRDANGCISQDGYLLLQPDAMTIALEGVVDGVLTINYGDSLLVTPVVGQGAGDLSYQWEELAEDTSIVCATCAELNVRPQTTRSYTLMVTDANGCTASTEFKVFVRRDYSVFVPSAFTPNGDGHNDVLMVHAKDGTRIGFFRIYDRWGERVFEQSDFPANDAVFGWDGTFKGQPMDAGLFVWQLETIFEDGNSATFKGSSLLLR